MSQNNLNKNIPQSRIHYMSLSLKFGHLKTIICRETPCRVYLVYFVRTITKNLRYEFIIFFAIYTFINLVFFWSAYSFVYIWTTESKLILIFLLKKWNLLWSVIFSMILEKGKFGFELKNGEWMNERKYLYMDHWLF